MDKIRHYDNEKNKNTFTPEDMKDLVDDYNTCREAIAFVKAYVNNDENKSEKYLEGYSKYAPTHIISDVALQVSRLREDGEGYKTFSHAQTNDIVHKVEEYEKYYNKTKEEYGELKQKSSEVSWKAIPKLAKEFKELNKINKNELSDEDLKALTNTNMFLNKVQTLVSKSSGREIDLSALENPLSYQRYVNIYPDAVDMRKHIETLGKMNEIMQNQINAREVQKKEENKETRNTSILMQNVKLKSDNKEMELLIAKLTKENESLKNENNALKKETANPHRAAAKDVINRIKKGITQTKR